MVKVELRSVPDCPNLVPVRRALYASLAELGQLDEVVSTKDPTPETFGVCA